MFEFFLSHLLCCSSNNEPLYLIRLASSYDLQVLAENEYSLTSRRRSCNAIRQYAVYNLALAHTRRGTAHLQKRDSRNTKRLHVRSAYTGAVTGCRRVELVYTRGAKRGLGALRGGCLFSRRGSNRPPVSGGGALARGGVHFPKRGGMACGVGGHSR